VSNGYDQDQEPIVTHLVEHSVVTDRDAPHVSRASELRAVGTSWFRAKLVNRPRHAPLNGSVELRELSSRRREKLDRIHTDSSRA
jgi:hypothetical protein